MKLLVIGSKGFIGSHVLAYYRSEGHEVFGCDIFQGNEAGYSRIDPQNPHYELLFTKRRFDVCINASGSAGVSFSISHPKEDFKLNVANVESLLEAIKKHNRACKFINFSSAAVYGNPKSLPIRETDALSPLSPYGKHKRLSERLLKQYCDEHKLSTCSLRVFSAYGPGLRKQLFWDIYRKLQQADKGMIELFGTGAETRDFVYIDDLISAVACVISRAAFRGEAINVASGTELTIRDAAHTFAAIHGRGYKVLFTGEEKAGDPKNWRADTSALRSLGFSPKTTLQTGLMKYNRWLRENA